MLALIYILHILLDIYAKFILKYNTKLPVLINNLMKLEIQYFHKKN